MVSCASIGKLWPLGLITVLNVMMHAVGCAKARILTHNHAMRRLLIIGCGDVALRAIPLLKQGYQVFALVRNPAYCTRLRALDVMPLLGDLDDRSRLARISGLADAEMQIRNWARRNQVKASILRVSGIYAADRVPLSRVQQGTPGIVASEDGYTNHIHADDLARISVAALQRGKACRVYHASDDSQLKTGEYFDNVADAFGLPRVPRISRAEAQLVLPETLLSFMNESRRLTNQRMKQELKVKLSYPTVADLLADVKP